MAKTILITQYGASRQANHRDHGAYGVMVIMSDLYQFRVYPGSHLAANKSKVTSIESVTLHLPAKSVIVFHGALIHCAVEYCTSGWARLSAHMYVDKKGVPMPENTTWPVDGEFGLDVLIEPVDSRLVLNTVPLPQPYWLTALFAEKKFSASCPQRCHAMGPDLPARLTLRNITRGDTAFGRVVVHEKLNTQFWIAGCVVKPRGARAGNVLWVYGPWEMVTGGQTNRRLVLFRAGCLNNKQTNLHKSLSVEADRVGMEFILQEAVAALENGMRELLIAPVENIQHHKKNAEGKFEGELLPVFTPPEPLKRKALSPPPTASTRSTRLPAPAAQAAPAPSRRQPAPKAPPPSAHRKTPAPKPAVLFPPTRALVGNKPPALVGNKPPGRPAGRAASMVATTWEPAPDPTPRAPKRTRSGVSSEHTVDGSPEVSTSPHHGGPVLNLPRAEVPMRIEPLPLDFWTPPQVQTTVVTDGSGIPSTGSQQLGVPAASPAGESQLPVATPAAEPGDAALHKRLADLKLQLEIKKLEEELRQREVTAGGGSSGASVGGSMAAAPIPSEQPQQQQQEQQQPPPQLQEQQQQFQASSAPPHGNEGVGFALQAPAEVRAATMPAGGNAMLFPLNSGCLPGGMLLSQGQQQTLPPQANALYQQFLPALGGRGQGLAEMYFGTNQQMPQDEPTVTLSLREAQLLGQRLMNPAQQARGGRGGRNMNLEEYLFFINQNR